MIVVLPFSHRDEALAEKLISWIVCLDPNLRNHTLVLLGSTLSSQDKQRQLAEQAKTVFGYVSSQRQRTPEERPWPVAPNAMFRVGSHYVAKTYRKPFLWLEPDAVPLKVGWLDTLEMEYQRCGRDFMGAVWDKPAKHMNGNGIYPAGFTYDGPDAVPFDVYIGRTTLLRTHATPLVHHEWGNIQTNTPWTFPDAESVKRVRKEAVLFHRSKDGGLITRLIEARNGRIEAAKPVNGTVKKAFHRIIKGFLRTCSTYYHSGNLGDIIYALYAIKLDGGGDLLIGPEQRGTSPCGVPIVESQFKLLLPLLQCQPYLRNIEFSPSYPQVKGFRDLNHFRNSWNDWSVRERLNIHTLCKMHCHTLDVLRWFKEDDTWLSVGGEKIHTGRIIVHRSSRYHAAKGFPWKALVERHGKKMLFVGLPSEHQAFCKEFGTISYWMPRDFLELAQLIAGGTVLCANQSFPLSLALAMGQRAICEAWENSPDCALKRPRYKDQQRNTIQQFEEWL